MKMGIKIGLLFLLAGSSWGQIFVHPQHNYQLDIPSGWRSVSADAQDLQLFQDQERSLIFGVRVVPSAQTGRITLAVLRNQVHQFLPDVEIITYEEFAYQGQRALIGLFQVTLDGIGYSGTIAWVQGKEAEYWIFGSTRDTQYEELKPWIYSAIDSFGLGEQGRFQSGLVSSYSLAITDPLMRTYRLRFNGQPITVNFDEAIHGVSQDTIEREAIIMMTYTEKNDESFRAWTRYYRMIYRDNYQHFTPLMEVMRPLMSGTPRQMAEQLLAFNQDFAYLRTPTTNSDLIAPITGALKKVGDCDSMSLSYIILLNHFNIEALLLLTQQKAHAITAVYVAGDNEESGVTWADGRRFIAAELTMRTPLGVIPDILHEVDDWFPILFAVM